MVLKYSQLNSPSQYLTNRHVFPTPLLPTIRYFMVDVLGFFDFMFIIYIIYGFQIFQKQHLLTIMVFYNLDISSLLGLMTDQSIAKISHVKELSLICFITMIYALCYQIQSPLEPFLVDKLVKDANEGQNLKQVAATTYAELKTFFSIVQWFASLGFGYLLDKFGVKVGYTINFLSCALCYYLLSISTTVDILYLSKIPGIGMAGYLCAQTAVAKITSPGPQRVRWFGLITTSYTIGGTVGPYLGGQLGSSGDYYTSGKYASLGSLLCLFLIFFLPKSLNQGKEKQDAPNTIQKVQKDERWSDKIKTITKLCWFFLLLKFFTCIINSIRRSTEPLILKELGVKEEVMGMILSSQFAFGGLTNAFIVPAVTNFFGGKSTKVVEKCLVSLTVVSIIQLISFYLVANQSDEIKIIVMVAVFWAIFQYTLAVSSTTYNTSIIPKNDSGTLLGLQSSIFAVGFMIGPSLGVRIWNNGGIFSLNWVTSIMMGICTVVVAIMLRKTKPTKQQ